MFLIPFRLHVMIRWLIGVGSLLGFMIILGTWFSSQRTLTMFDEQQAFLEAQLQAEALHNSLSPLHQQEIAQQLATALQDIQDQIQQHKEATLRNHIFGAITLLASLLAALWGIGRFMMIRPFQHVQQELHASRQTLDEAKQELLASKQALAAARQEIKQTHLELELAVEEHTTELHQWSLEMEKLNEIMQVVSSSLDIDKVMTLIMEALQNIFTFEKIGLGWVDESSQDLVFYRFYGEELSAKEIEQLQQVRFSLKNSDSIFTSTVVWNDPNYVPEITPELVEHFSEIDRRVYDICPLKSILIYPLQVQDTMIGALFFGNMHQAFSLSEEKIRSIQRYVTHVGSALNNAKVYDDLKTTRIQLAESEKIAAMTQNFEKFVPKEFLQRIAKEGLENIELGKAHTTSMTILFADLRDFAPVSETMAPQELLNFLNAYFQRMNDPILHFGGFIDKFIGDAIMALFDSPEQQPGQAAHHAVSAAIAMQEALQEYNKLRENGGYAPIASGIGLHSGPVVIGTVGSEDRMDSTVLGDSVNLASRLEGLTKYYEAGIIISYDTFALLENFENHFYRELDWLRVKGRSEPMQIYEIFDFEPKSIRRKKKKAGQFLQHGLYLRQTRRWDEAIEAFQNALKIYPEDQAAQFHIRQCEELKAYPPEPDWDGASIFTSK